MSTTADSVTATDTVANAGLSQNQMLQASHHILSLLEKSKEHIEEFVDGMPNVFAIIDSAENGGSIIKGNTRLAAIMQKNLEQVLGLSLARAFKPASWEIFCFNIRNAIASPTAEATFELPLDATTNKDQIFSWTVRPFQGAHGDDQKMVTVFGVDVSKIRAYERQLTHIFSTIPLGIMRLDGTLCVQAPHSQFASTLLGEDQLDGKNIFDFLFKPAWEFMSTQDREYAQNLKGIVGFASFQFDAIRDSLPRQVSLKIARTGQLKVIGINYDAIIQDDEIEGLLVVLEDRTELERIRTEQEARRKEEEAVVIRFVEVRRLDPNARRAIEQDLVVYFEKLVEAVRANDLPRYLKTLHGIKGTARVAQLTRLKEIAHGTEAYFLGLKAAEKAGWTAEVKQLEAIADEWREVLTIVRAYQDTTASPRAAPQGPIRLAFVEQSLKLIVDETSRSLGKKVVLQCDFGELTVRPATLAVIKETFMHLLNNALDHGVESPADRTAAGKPEYGTLAANAREINGEIILVLTDDGRGIDGHKVATSAVRKGLVAAESLAKMSAEDKINLIFMEGTSTKDTATEISGRGIGLGAVQEAINELGGSIYVESTIGAGSKFILRFKV